MRKGLAITVGVLLFVCAESRGQIASVADKAYKHDTLRVNSYAVYLDALFYITDNEMNAYPDVRFTNAVWANYLFRRHDVELSFRQIVERKDSGEWYYNHYLILSGGIFKFRPLTEHRSVIRRVYAEPVFIYQNNSDRGLRRRFQIGALVHPWSLVLPRFKLNVALGAVYDWSSWEVNSAAGIEGASPELREKILFINERMPLRKNMYQDHSEWRPMVTVGLNWRMNEILSLGFYTAYQQSLVSPYSAEIRAEYPDLGKVHPYIQMQLDLQVKLYRGFALKLTGGLDYENSNMSLYKSSWSYNMLVGGSWSFSNQKYRSGSEIK